MAYRAFWKTKNSGRVSEPLTTDEMLGAEGAVILGVNPPVRDFAYMDLWSKPLGLLYALSYLRRRNKVSLLDCVAAAAEKEISFGRLKIRKTETEKPEVYRGVKRKYNHFGLTAEEMKERLKNVETPDCVLLTSGMTYWYPGVKFAIETMNEIFPNAPVVLGGVYASLCPKHAARIGADYVICDREEPRGALPAMDLYGKIGYGVTMTSFGCPFSCEYCASKILWRGYKRRELRSVLYETEYQAALGARDIAFYDDALLLDKEFFYELCARLRKRAGAPLRLHTPNGLHVRQIDERCANVLYESGFKTIRLSLESVDPAVSHAGSDKVKRNEYASAVKKLLSAGYSQRDCETYVLLGLPGQSVCSVKETIKFVKENGGTPKLAEFSPIPGTPAFEKAAAENPNLRYEPLLHNNSVYCSYFSNAVTPAELQELKDEARIN